MNWISALSWLKWPLIGGTALALYLFGYNSGKTSNELTDAMEQARLADQRAAAVASSIQALEEFNRNRVDRVVRTERIIGEIRNAEVTTGCGPSVDAAVNSLRD